MHCLVRSSASCIHSMHPALCCVGCVVDADLRCSPLRRYLFLLARPFAHTGLTCLGCHAPGYKGASDRPSADASVPATASAQVSACVMRLEWQFAAWPVQPGVSVACHYAACAPSCRHTLCRRGSIPDMAPSCAQAQGNEGPKPTQEPTGPHFLLQGETCRVSCRPCYRLHFRVVFGAASYSTAYAVNHDHRLVRSWQYVAFLSPSTQL